MLRIKKVRFYPIPKVMICLRLLRLGFGGKFSRLVSIMSVKDCFSQISDRRLLQTNFLEGNVLLGYDIIVATRLRAA